MLKIRSLLGLQSQVVKSAQSYQARCVGTTLVNDKNELKCPKPGRSKPPVLVTFGNPILDSTFRLDTDEIFKKFNLIPNSQYLKSTKEITEIRNYALKLTKGKFVDTPGGSSLNTAKILGALLQGKQTILFCGAVGNDKAGEKLRKLVTDVKLEFETIPKVPTGTCLCLIWKDNACLIADIGASAHYKLEHMCTKKMKKYYDKSHFIYAEGFFLPGRFKEVKYLMDEVCPRTRNVFIWNLSAAYVSTTFPKESKYITERADFVVGNVEQFIDLGQKSFQLKKLQNIMARTFKKHRCVKKKCKHFVSKLAVATDGPKPIHMFYTKKNYICYEKMDIPPVDPKEIKDTTGAGDSFLAGFLRGYLANKSARTCADFGVQVSKEVINNVGVKLSDDFLKNIPPV